MAAQPSHVIVARIVAPFGIKGEVKAEVLTDFPDRLALRQTVLLGREDEALRRFTIRSVRFHQGQALLTFEECPDRTAAEGLRGLYVQIPSSEAAPLPDGHYYYHQIIGLDVWGTDGLPYGKITSVMTTGSNDVYVVEGERGRILVPALAGVVSAVDIEAGRMTVDMAALQ
jgi:16S rRNA processing protein RimM